MEWTVNEVAERAGISGRTLRHYHQIGLLTPDRVGFNGYRYYGPDAVARLQRILLLREMGMPLAEIAAALDMSASPEAEVAALSEHLAQLAKESEKLAQRIDAVKHTLAMRREGRQPRMDVMLEGFNDRYETEVVELWGRDAFEASNQWWHNKSVQQQQDWKKRSDALLSRWSEIQAGGYELHSAVAQKHAAAHMKWFEEIPGTPAHAGDRCKTTEMALGLADQYASNPEFHIAFGTADAACFAANALRLHLRNESDSYL